MVDKPKLMAHLRTIPDYPVKGIVFFDVTTLFKDAECLKMLVDDLYDHYKDKGITKVVGVESRGYIAGSALALRLGAGFIMARKPGKLPAEKLSESYSKEYGTDSIEIHADAIDENDVVLIHDDLLATGGTVAATYRLVKRFNPKTVYMSFNIALDDVPKLDIYPQDAETYSILHLTEHDA